MQENARLCLKQRLLISYRETKFKKMNMTVCHPDVNQLNFSSVVEKQNLRLETVT